MDLHSCIDDFDALRSLFRSPSQRLNKEIDHIDDAAESDDRGLTALYFRDK